jgi:hypothetical protein
MKVMADRFQIEIDEAGEGISADALRLHLEQALRFLEDSEEAAGLAPGTVQWKVTGASMNSPLRLQLERWIRPGEPEPANRPGEELARAFARLQRGEALGDELSTTRLHALEQMAAHSNGVRQVRVKAGVGDSIAVRPEWATALKRARVDRRLRDQLPEQTYSLVGRLEGVNVHGGKSEFYVYDPLTDQKMRCLFAEEMLEQVGRLLSQRVEVAGVTKFGPGSVPQSMHVETLRPIQTRAGSFLDRLRAAHERGGITFTGGLTVEEAIDEVRSGTD